MNETKWKRSKSKKERKKEKNEKLYHKLFPPMNYFSFHWLLPHLEGGLILE